MATTTLSIPSNVRILGDLTVVGNLPAYARSALAQEALACYPILPTAWRVHDAIVTPLPATPSAANLGLVGGTFGTDVPTLQSEDLKAAGATNKYARVLIALPVEYEAGQTVVIRLRAAMLTTAADVAATIDLSVYRSDRDGAAESATDLVTTSAQSMNSTTPADLDFTINSGGLSPGDVLDLRVHVIVNDAATATAVKAEISAAELLCDIRG